MVAVQVPIADWIELLERICDLEEQLRPTTKLDRQLDALVRQRTRKKKDLSLDDIGLIGTGRPLSKAESLLISAHIQVNMARNARQHARSTSR
ncbi:MAG TPA: hypothetical protein PKE21_08785 [Flavobacteriales bacterium]|nr:hypothetical protein [Flavobacteriales bacterium]HMR27557.1 hypothetical protein [Flavobacteriales bacterium]